MGAVPYFHGTAFLYGIHFAAQIFGANRCLCVCNDFLIVGLVGNIIFVLIIALSFSKKRFAVVSIVLFCSFFTTSLDKKMRA